MHDWDEAKNRALLRRSFEALPTAALSSSASYSSMMKRPGRRRPH